MLVILAAAAALATTADTGRVFTDKELLFSHTPSYSDILTDYPEKASSLEKEGTATVLCTISAQGRMEACAVEQETPAGWGFGKATVKFVHRAVVAPQARDGSPTAGARVRMKIVWQIRMA